MPIGDQVLKITIGCFIPMHTMCGFVYLNVVQARYRPNMKPRNTGEQCHNEFRKWIEQDYENTYMHLP